MRRVYAIKYAVVTFLELKLVLKQENKFYIFEENVTVKYIVVVTFLQLKLILKQENKLQISEKSLLSQIYCSNFS